MSSSSDSKESPVHLGVRSEFGIAPIKDEYRATWDAIRKQLDDAFPVGATDDADTTESIKER